MATPSNESHLERIPAAHWIAAPFQTFRVWRRMTLWNLHDYRAALEEEITRRLLIARLEDLYHPRDWRKEAPFSLVQRLRKGLDIQEATAQVDELTNGTGADDPRRRHN